MNGKRRGSAMKTQSALMFSTVSAVVLTVTLASVTAVLIENEVIQANGAGYCVMGILVTVSMAAGLLAAELVKNKHIQVCMAAGICYFMSLIAMTALFFGGQYTGTLTTFLMIVVGSLLSALIEMRKNGQGRRSRFKR